MIASRRVFLKSTAAFAATSIGSSRGQLALADLRSGPLSQFNYGEVELLDGPLRRQFDANHAAYSTLDENSLLKPFRQRAGLPAPGHDMGGWYSWASIEDFGKPDDNGFAPGHAFGQYLSGLSRDFAATGNVATQQKVHRLVLNLAPAVSKGFWEGNRFPAYIFDKLCIGLVDAHRFAAAPQALNVLNAVLDSVSAHLPPGPLSRDQQYARPHRDESFCWDEPYTLPENAFLAAESGAGERFRSLALRYLADDWYFDPLAAGHNVLPGKHAYSHVNALSSAMKAWFVLGDEKYLRAARNGFEMLVASQSFATGGWGPDEQFRVPGSGDLGESLIKSHSSFETPCGSYAHFKLTRYLIRATGDSLYGDSMERVLYNCILGARPILPDGHGFYYSDYNRDGSKVYHPSKWHCCTGTFSQVTADYGVSTYFHDHNGVYVNLYVPSRVTWTGPDGRVTLAQQTSYPFEPTAQIAVSAGKPVSFGVYLRIPAWAGPKTAVSVNGKHLSIDLAPGRFAAIHRTWRNNDRIEIAFDMHPVLQSVDPQHPNLMALVHGPLALFALGSIPEKVGHRDLLSAAQLTPGSESWRAKTAAGPLTLGPFPVIGNERYRLYLNVEG